MTFKKIASSLFISDWINQNHNRNADETPRCNPSYEIQFLNHLGFGLFRLKTLKKPGQEHGSWRIYVFNMLFEKYFGIESTFSGVRKRQSGKHWPPGIICSM